MSKNDTKRFKWTDLLLHTSDKSLSFLLVSLAVLMFVIYPFFSLGAFGQIILDVFFSFILISGAFVADRGIVKIVAVVLAVLSMLVRWASHLAPNIETFTWNAVLMLIFSIFATGIVLARVFQKGRITHYRIQGAIAVYLLLGLIWGIAYILVELQAPGSFNLSTSSIGNGLSAELMYYSIVTLTTVGYGDITPVSAAARNLSNLEGLVGQLYPAILIARLVSLEITHRVIDNK
jgi:hypothetical protein